MSQKSGHSAKFNIFTLLKDDFQRPASGVDPVGFEEVELPVCGNESVPLPPLVPLGEEQTYIAACKGHIDGDKTRWREICRTRPSGSQNRLLSEDLP